MLKIHAGCSFLLLAALGAQTQTSTQVRTFVTPVANVTFASGSPGTFTLPTSSPWLVSLPQYNGPRVLTGVRLKLDVQFRRGFQATMTQATSSLDTQENCTVRLVPPFLPPSGAMPAAGYGPSSTYSWSTWTPNLIFGPYLYPFTSSTGFRALTEPNLPLFQGNGTIDIPFSGSFQASGSVPNGAMSGIYSYAGSIFTVTVEYTTEAAASVYGAGCAGTGNVVPQIGLQGRANIAGNPFAVTLQQTAPQSLTLLALALQRGVVPLTGGCTFLLDLNFVPVSVYVTSPTGDGSSSLTLPNTPSLVGTYFYGQHLVFDAQGAHENWLALTPGIGMLIGH